MLILKEKLLPLKQKTESKVSIKQTNIKPNILSSPLNVKVNIITEKS